MIAALYSRRTENTRPFLVSITSTADAATGLAFGVGTSLAATTKAFNKVAVPGPADRLESERSFYTKTPGHNEMLINHFTKKLSKTIAAHGLPALETNLSHNLSAEVFTLDGSGDTLELWKIEPVGNVDVPYWNVKVDPSIIKNHGDLWNKRAEAMMAGIFRMANPMLNREAKPRANLQKTPDRNRSQQRQN
jgi:hypothetical protein